MSNIFVFSPKLLAHNGPGGMAHESIECSIEGSVGDSEWHQQVA